MRRALALVLLLGAPPGRAEAKLLLSQKEALALALPGARPSVKNAFLTEEERARAQTLARAKVESRLWTYYVGESSGVITGYAYFDRALVRTQPATLIVAVSTAGTVGFVEILTFDEPEDYLPRKRWLELFRGKPLSEDLRLRGAVKNVAGASLTSETVVSAVRRCLAVHAILHPAQEAATP